MPDYYETVLKTATTELKVSRSGKRVQLASVLLAIP